MFYAQCITIKWFVVTVHFKFKVMQWITSTGTVKRYQSTLICVIVKMTAVDYQYRYSETLQVYFDLCYCQNDCLIHVSCYKVTCVSGYNVDIVV